MSRSSGKGRGGQGDDGARSKLSQLQCDSSPARLSTKLESVILARMTSVDHWLGTAWDHRNADIAMTRRCWVKTFATRFQKLWQLFCWPKVFRCLQQWPIDR